MPSKAKPAAARLADVPLELIDEPPRPIRQTMDEDKLAELIESLREVGLIEPLVLEQTGKRYRIEAGHRRFVAARALYWKTVPSIIHAEGTLKRHAVKLHENIIREDLNAAEEANWYAQLLEEECGGDVDMLCDKVKKKRTYVEGRLLIRYGDAEVFAALTQKQINFSVAKELNLVKDEGMRRVYLDAAKKGGASALQVRIWKAHAETLSQVPPPDPGDGTNQYDARPTTQFRMECLCCEQNDEPWDMELVYVHRRCRILVLDRFLGQVKGVMHAGNENPGAGVDDRRPGAD